MRSVLGSTNDEKLKRGILLIDERDPAGELVKEVDRVPFSRVQLSVCSPRAGLSQSASEQSSLESGPSMKCHMTRLGGPSRVKMPVPLPPLWPSSSTVQVNLSVLRLSYSTNPTLPRAMERSPSRPNFSGNLGALLSQDPSWSGLRYLLTLDALTLTFSADRSRLWLLTASDPLDNDFVFGNA